MRKIVETTGGICVRCRKPGAGCMYRGGLYHMTCKMEQRADEKYEAEHGEWPELPPDVLPSALTDEQRAEWERLTVEAAGTTRATATALPDLADMMRRQVP